ncbi:MAG: cupin domain-containing protein [Armatimonadota bacterium]|nr:cupin domain-containing protein [Armatimonadota bacterium]MDR7532055.1 cupin domain-containing protein [Armatimonadota bacterium]MDR7535986.1 cupin domain-containing protein [Armatimonadota bacterium]
MSAIRVVCLDDAAVDLPLATGGGRVRALLRPEVGARERALLYIELPAAATSAILRHPAEAAYFVVRGAGAVVERDRPARPVREAQMVYVPAGLAYQLVGPAVFAGGPCPPDPALASPPTPAGAGDPTPDAGPAGVPAGAGEDAPGEGGPSAVRIFDPMRHGVPMPMIARRSWLVIGPHTGARYAVMNLVELEPGEMNTPHVHPASEDSLFVLRGSGWAHNLDTGERLALHAACALVVPPGVRHAVEAGPAGLHSIGGPVPPDVGMLEAMGLTM